MRRLRGVDRGSGAHLHHHDPALSSCAAPRLFDGERLTPDLADLAPGRNRLGGKRAVAVDRAQPDVERVLVAVRPDVPLRRRRTATGHDAFRKSRVPNPIVVRHTAMLRQLLPSRACWMAEADSRFRQQRLLRFVRQVAAVAATAQLSPEGPMRPLRLRRIHTGSASSAIDCLAFSAFGTGGRCSPCSSPPSGTSDRNRREPDRRSSSPRRHRG